VKNFLAVNFAILLSFLLFANEPQKLAERSYEVCGSNFALEIADTPRARALGMMFRSGTQKGKGMLFSFPEPQMQSFWMRNVAFALDIGFFDEQGRLINFHTMKAGNPLKKDEYMERYLSHRPAIFAVEVEAGFFAKQKSSCRISPVPPAAKN
jgi:uncharacterized membrane protein (UPF0127 family)